MDEEQTTEIVAYKGFDADLKCRGFQYAVGQTYEHEGEVKACGSGFHACEHPMNVFDYYPPAGSRFAVVRMSGEISRELGGDTKLASAKITIDAEIGISTLVQRAVEWAIARCTPEGEEATGLRGAASATGTQGAASATGDHGAASATGTQGAASATSYQGAASATGKASVALAAGFKGKARGAGGCALFLVNRNDDGEIRHVFAGKVGENGVKPDTWYSLGDDGSLVEVQ